jgi:phage-related protein
MADWEQYRAAWEQEEAFRRQCCEKLQRVKEFLRTHKQWEERMWRVPRETQNKDDS